MKNQEIANIFRQMAQLLELKGDNPFRIRAYERAAQNIESLGQDLGIVLEEDSLTSIPGIGADLAGKIKEIISTGTFKQFEELKKEIPDGLLKMMAIPGLGPKTVKKIYEELKIDSIDKLERAAKAGTLRTLEGIREKTEENILRGIALLKKGAERTPISIALDLADEFLKGLGALKEIEKIEVAGSLRRRKETIRDIDILVVSAKPSFVMECFVKLALVKEIIAKGETKSAIISKENNIQADLRVVEKKSFGSALLYFTGSKEFNIKLRQLAIKKGYKINEYGIFSTKGKEEEWIAGRTEQEVFSLLKMSYIPPELREDRGEIEAALENRLPKLIERKDIRGDFHVHSKYSDGTATIADIANAVEKFNYEYVAVCDHSQGLRVAGGLTLTEVYKKLEEIRRVNKTSKVRLLSGTEVDISSEGKLDYSESLLKEFDVVVAAIHSGFKQSKQQLTKRIVSACKNKQVNIIAHPSGRLWGAREGYELNWDEVFRVARDYQVAIEINCYPQRLDLNDIHCMEAKKLGTKMALGTDSHILEQLKVMDLGVSVARRGWLEKKDIINCMNLEELLKWLKK